MSDDAFVINDNQVASRPRHPRDQVDTSRKLHLGHFAFMRAVVQGIDSSRAWERYLQIEGSHLDARTVRRTIAWIRDAFAAATRRQGRHGTARLVVADIDNIIPETSGSVSLEAFIELENLDGFSQYEQLQAFEAKYGTASMRHARRGRLLTKQLEALLFLEQLVAEPPSPGDPIACWINPDLAGHLAKANLFALRQLIDHINGNAKRWYRTIPALGVSKAKRITDWLRMHEASIGMSLGSHVGVSRALLVPGQLKRVVSRQTAIVPLDKLIVPHELDGSQGVFRAPLAQCMLAARNDHEAVLTWLRTRHGITSEERITMKRARGIDPAAPEGPLDWLHYLSHTQRSYLKEAERFMLWAVVQHGKPLSSLTLEDCEQYRQFLADPQPRETWCSKTRFDRWSPLWKPFRDPLASAAQRLALTILRSMYTFLVDQGYLTGNPWRGVSAQRTTRVAIMRGRAFTRDQWAFIEDQAAALPPMSSNKRLQLALRLYYTTGMRLIEGVQARVDDLRHVEYPDPDTGGVAAGWELLVLGKGQKERIVSVPDLVVEQLGEYLVSRGLDADITSSRNRDAYIFGLATDGAERAPGFIKGVVDPKAGIHKNLLFQQLKAFFRACANVMTPIDPCGAERLALGSTHWLRHTHGTHAVAAGMPLDVVQMNMGHASLDTTTGYITSESARRLKASRKVFG